MTDISSAFENDPENETWNLIEEIGADALDICCRYQLVSEGLGIDLEHQTYSALNALVSGEPLADAVALLDPAHPFTHKVVEELGRVAQTLVDGHNQPRLRFLS